MQQLTTGVSIGTSNDLHGRNLRLACLVRFFWAGAGVCCGESLVIECFLGTGRADWPEILDRFKRLGRFVDRAYSRAGAQRT